jgi:hypothetical protein
MGEHTPYATRFACVYTGTKIPAEQSVLAANTPGGLLTCALRPNGIWGAGGSIILDTLMEKLKAGQMVARIGGMGGLHDHVHIDNLVHAHLLAADALVLAALVPKPRVNLTRYHGVLAPNHRWRGWVTPARRGKALKKVANTGPRTPAECHAAMTWAQRLKRVFNIDIEACGRCGGAVRVIACIEDQGTIDQVLAHLHRKEQDTPVRPLLAPPTRAPPAALSLFAGKEPALSRFNQPGRR